MILQALNDYYRRKIDDPDPSKRLPTFGLEQKEIPFVLEITRDGVLVQIEDTRTLVAKKLIAQTFRVPQGEKKTSGVTANLLWDTAEYVLAIPDPKKLEQSKEKGKEAEYLGRLIEMQTAFRSRVASLPARAQADDGVIAIKRFFESDSLLQVSSQANFNDLTVTGGLVTFRLHADLDLVCQRSAIVNAILNTADAADTPHAMCLVSGEVAPVERLHAAIKGVWGAQSSGANIVSFNARAFESYGKTERQGENAPVGKAAAFAYTTALNHLLGKNSTRRIQVGDASTVFWAEKQSDLEGNIVDVFGEPTADEPDRNTRAVKAMYESHLSGKLGGLEGDNCFNVLGLAPNAARISVRFYHRLPLRDLATRVLAHFEDIKLERGKADAEYPSLFRLLTAVSVQGKSDNIPPTLGGALVDAIFGGPAVPYPSLWLNKAVNRTRALKADDKYFQSSLYLCTSAIKGCLNRTSRNRFNEVTEKEFLPMLDLTNDNTAYRLGRLFSALEKIQEEANPKINATIRDRFYGAASSTPVTVFTSLLRLKNHHLKKLDIGRATWFEKLLGEILAAVSDFPAHLTLQDQGRFALGYYHQRQAFFTKNDPTASNPSATEGAPK